MFLWFFNRCALIRVTSPLSEAGCKHKCHADLVEQHVIRQLISTRAYTKPVWFSVSVDAQKRLKPASTEDRYKYFCSVDRPLASLLKLATLPPTNVAFGWGECSESTLQIAIWRHALEPDLPSLQPTFYGGEQNCSNSLMPTTAPEGSLLLLCSC